MGFDEGRVWFDHGNLTYFAGQPVNARLEFKQDKVKTFRGIYVLARGFCETHWTTEHSRRISRTGSRASFTEYYTENHDGSEVYFEYKIYLIGAKQGECKLNPGEHSFPFQIILPANCPTSSEFQHGHIRYEFKIVVDRAFKLDQEKKLRINVVNPIDLNMIPYCREPMAFQFNDPYYCCCVNFGTCKVTVKVPQSGFCPKQIIPIELECVNDSKVDIDRIKFEIKESITYRATDATKYENRKVANLKKGNIPSGTSRHWELQMDVPDMAVINLASCSIIDIDFRFEVTVSPEGCHSKSQATRAIILGNIPLRNLDQGNQIPLQQAEIQHNPNTYPPPYPTTPSYPSGNSGYPVGNSPYPSDKSPNVPDNLPFPVNTSPYPGDNLPVPGGISAYPGGIPHTGNPPYPLVAPPYPSSNLPNPKLPPYSLIAPYPENPPGVTPSFPTVTPYPPGPCHPIPSPGLGFNIAGDESKPGPMPLPTPATANPYSTASAPDPS